MATPGFYFSVTKTGGTMHPVVSFNIDPRSFPRDTNVILTRTFLGGTYEFASATTNPYGPTSGMGTASTDIIRHIDAMVRDQTAGRAFVEDNGLMIMSFATEERDSGGNKIGRPLAMISFHIQADGTWSNIPPPVRPAASPPVRPRILWIGWLLLCAAFLGLAWWSIARRRRRARCMREGRCVACGYDLRATPEQCPECGLVQKLSGDQLPPPATGI